MAYIKLKFIKLGSVWDHNSSGQPYMTKEGLPYASGKFDEDITIKKGEVLRVFTAQKRGPKSPKFNVILCRPAEPSDVPYEKPEESDASEPEVEKHETFVPDDKDSPF